METYEIQIVLTNKFGEFVGRKSIMTNDQYHKLQEIAKNFYVSGGFELTLEDDSFIVVPPDVVQQSILKIKKKKIEYVQEQI